MKFIRTILFVCFLCAAIIPMGWSAQGNNNDASYSNRIIRSSYKEVNASHILVSTKDEALMIREEILNGASFENMAKKYSKCPSGANGGNLGYFGRGIMAQEFEDAAFDLPVGKISSPVKTQFGYHLIKVINKR